MSSLDSQLNEMVSLVEAKRVCATVREKINAYEMMKRSPLLFLTETVREEINKIDIQREEEIQKLDKYYGDLITKIRVFEETCKSEIATVAIPQDSFESMKNEIEEDETFLFSLKSDESRCKD